MAKDLFIAIVLCVLFVLAVYGIYWSITTILAEVDRLCPEYRRLAIASMVFIWLIAGGSSTIKSKS